MKLQTQSTVLLRAGRMLKFRRFLRRAGAAAGLLAAAACLGEFCALWQLSARLAGLEAAACAAESASAAAESEAAAPSPTPTCSPTPTPTVYAAAGCAALYPELSAAPLPEKPPAAKTVYLTFDDGPSANTAAILDLLAAHEARGTWFIVGTQLAGREDLIRRMAAEGHAVALHTDSHEYADIYASPEAFFGDLDLLAHKLAAITGETPGLLRFAGGSVNHYDAGSYPALTAEALRRGLRYYDWNVSAQDAVKKSPPATVIAQRVIDGVEGLSPDVPAIVLMHDTKSTTPAALPEILDTLGAGGYTFAALDSSVPMIAFSGGETYAP